MRNSFVRAMAVFHVMGWLLILFGVILLIPMIIALYYRNTDSQGLVRVYAFLFPAIGSFVIGGLLHVIFKRSSLDSTGAALLCAVVWIVFSILGAVPFQLILGCSFVDGFFEAMSGFTTTGITVLAGLDEMPRCILFWRALTQWMGGLGILSLFLLLTFSGASSCHIFEAESHKIASSRPVPGLFNTLKIFWGIYAGFTLLSMIALTLEGMPFFDSLCHSFAALSTGGFSPHDASIEYYRQMGHPNYRLIEYTVAFFMLLGGINFLIHFRVVIGDLRALWDNVEMRYFWRLLALFLGIIIFEKVYRVSGQASFAGLSPVQVLWRLEDIFRTVLFQVISLVTTTGFGTKDINTDYFGSVAKQLFIVMMFIGGCAGSTAGGFKVLRIVILNRLVSRELFRLRVGPRTSSALVVDGKIVSHDEVYRVAALFFGWLLLIVMGGLITALCSNHGAFASLSGMFSAVGNIGPCYISVPDIATLNPAVKLTYILGMLAGRLELLPVILLFSRKAWTY